MWATTSTHILLPTYIPKTPSSLSTSKPPLATTHLRRRGIIAAASYEETSGLGQTELNPNKSGPSMGSTPTKKAQQQQEEKPNERGGKEKKKNQGNEISGSVILRAIQKANTKKAGVKKKQQQQQQKRVKLKASSDVNEVVDYDKIRPVTIKSDWATRLNDLEKRLQELLSL